MNTTLRALALLLLLATLWACDAGTGIDDVRSLQAQGRYADTLEALRAMLETTPDDPEVNFLYGRALSRTSSSPIAIWSLKKASEDPAWRTRAYLELTAASMQNGDAPGAIENATVVLEAVPDSLTALSLRGMAHLHESQAEEALADFDAILDLHPNDEPTRSARASALIMLGRVDEAAEAIAAIESDAGRYNESLSGAVMCAARATLEAERGETDAARQAFDVCLETFPTDGFLVPAAIAFHDGLGEFRRTEEILEAALAASPGTARYRKMLSDRALEAGDGERAEEILLEGAKRPDPRTRGDAWTDLTNLYLGRGDVDSAIDAYRHAIAATPNPSQLAQLTLADLLARAERHEEALELAKGLERDSYRGLIEARIHLNEGRPRDALARLDEVFPTWPNNPGARYYAARAAEQLGDFSRAIEEYRQSIRSDPEQTEAALRLSKLYFHAGSFQNAWNSAAEHYRSHNDDAEGVRMMLRAASSAEGESVQNLLARLSGSPLWPTALAMRAERIESTQGSAAALEALDAVDGFDFTAPDNAETLRVRIRLLVDLDRNEQALAESADALGASAESGALHEIRGFVLDATGADPAEVRARLEAAVALEPSGWRPAYALGRHLEGAGSLEEALSQFRRAAEVAPGEPAPGRAIAEVLARMGRGEETEAAWEAHLREQPWDAEAALALTRIRIASARTDDRTVELAERAVLFRGPETALDTLIDLHKSRGEVERAEALAAAARENRSLPPLRITPIEGVGV
ncbi:MAG: hypothetical protein CL931_11550 [Deltaproteobacteria bacterium]|nr:hypothetical protein [Deltaproteobacteria bacterium]